MSAEIIA
jgi:hypothetical protein